MLKRGQILSADLRDSRGSMLLAAGLPVTDGLIRQLAEQGVHEVYLDDSIVDASASPLQTPYDSRMQEKLRHNFNRLSESLSDFYSSVRAGQSTSTDEVEEVVVEYLQATLKDTGVVLASCMELDGNRLNPIDEELQRRSVRMAMLATIAAHQLGLPDADCVNAGIVGSLHDISLYGRDSLELDDSYFEHPLRSMDLLEGTFGFTDQMRMLVGQVHEQCDGSGYPRHLKAPRLHMVSRVLNVVDAFLTLIEPNGSRPIPIAPADALAYLVQQSLFGYFDRDCVQALVSVASIYPVGTKVQLDDGSSAIVYRSTGVTYMQPVVRLDSPKGAEGSIVDLRFSERIIMQPADEQTRFRRLAKSSLNEVLWRPAA